MKKHGLYKVQRDKPFEFYNLKVSLKKMALFYSSDMPEFKTMKTIYANRVHKFVSEWLDSSDDLSVADRKQAWNDISRVKLGNLLRPDTIRPKKYKNKYICFCELMRPRLKAKHPEKPIEEITKLMGAQWKTFSQESDPVLYEEVSALWALDQKRYSVEKTLSDSLLAKEKKPKKSSDYLQFCKQKRTENPKISMLELAEQWQKYKQENIKFEDTTPENSKSKSKTKTIPKTKSAANVEHIVSEKLPL
uniref:High mobility group protein homolog n=1 Tax=Rhinella marina erythrocytic-like virus TaxID=2859906 RepID=A0A8F6UAA7_9VIRU|nr:high mobility group protein homolog [Rhinella marina erythrocytic-like virus]